MAVTDTHSVHLFNPATNAKLATLQCVDAAQISVDTPEGAGDIQFSPDGNLLAVTTRENSIQIWDIPKLRTELSAMDLDWSSTSSDSQTASQ